MLHTGAVPPFDLETWDFRTGGLVEAPLALSYLIFMDADKAGDWERLGYHMYGDPFQEQRFS